MAACGGGGGGGGGGDDEPPPLPQHTVAVTVRVPAGTPGPLALIVMPFEDYQVTARIPLVERAPDVWSGTVDLEDGALVRYSYDRSGGVQPLSDLKNMREASGTDTRIENRFVLVVPELQAIDDVIETWQDRRDLRMPTGTLTGVVRDAGTGAPLVDALVSAGGIHTASGFDGSYRIDGLAAGTQRVVVTTTLGEHRPAQATVAVPSHGAAALDLALAAAPEVLVAFDATLPESTPADAEVRFIGNVYAAGARHFATFPARPESLRAPITDRSTPGHARITLPLHEGTYIQYAYTIGGDQAGSEFRLKPRSLIVPAGPTVQHGDLVATWVPNGLYLVTLRVTVPASTPAGTPVALQIGPSHWMTRTGPRSWVFYSASRPGDQIRYQYVLGGDIAGNDLAGERSIVVGERDTVIDDVVEQWAGLPDAALAAAGAPIAVTVRAALPGASGQVRVVGDGALAGGPALVAMAGEPWQRSTTITAPAGTALHYHFEDDGGGRSPDFAWTPSYAGEVRDDAVAAWTTAPLPPGGTRPSYITGAYLPDFWSPAFAVQSASTFDRLRQHAVGWVALSSVWSYGQIQPLPTLEPRPRLAGSVFTPREELRAQAALARARGLGVVLAPQFNMEMSPGGMDALDQPKSPAWWDAWLVEAERFWMWNAQLAEQIGAGALVLPGPMFHVFYQSGSYGTPEDEHQFDLRVQALVAEVRAVYHGRLIISGGVQSFDFPGSADLIGVTTFDLGRPALPYDATAQQWATAYEAVFADKVDAIYARWGKPVFLYTIALSPDAADPDPSAQATQSRQLEGIMRAIAARPWIAGSLSWAYQMIDAPALRGDGLRARAAEGVLAREYATFVTP